MILDAGHGGRDTGTLHGGVWESTYVYDVACRLRRILSERTRAEVLMTTRDAVLGWKVPERDALRSARNQVLLTEPVYALQDPTVGVNLRWYLANSLIRRPGPDGTKVPPERTVFVSLHADSLHPSVRGAMVYVPGERYLRDRYGKTGPAYAGYREVKEQPVVSFNRKERVASEGASTALANAIVSALREAGLPVHPFSPVRTHVIRGRPRVGAGRPPVQPGPESRPRRAREPRQRGGPRAREDARVPRLRRRMPRVGRRELLRRAAAAALRAGAARAPSAARSGPGRSGRRRRSRAKK